MNRNLPIYRAALRCLMAIAPAVCLAQGQFTCQRTDVPLNARSEGLAELVSDIVLKCSGGTPTSPGAVVPRYQVLVTSTAPLASRILVAGSPNTGISEALLLIDEPSFTEQTGCPADAAGEGCTAVSGKSSNPNVFQARQLQANTITFRNVPLDPPGTHGSRILRITNLRANMAALAAQSPANKSAHFTAQIFDQNGVPLTIQGTEPASAESSPGLVFSVRTVADTAPYFKSTPAITIPPASLPTGTPQALMGFNLKFSEGFPGAFRRRNVGTSSYNPLFMTVQAVPGLSYGTETGFLNTLLPDLTQMNLAGLADSGTRLIARFQNIPKNVLLWASVRDTRAGTTQYSESSPRAVLTTADSNGLGPFTPPAITVNGLSQLAVLNGTATAVWEIVSASPASIQDVSFQLSVTAQTANPAQGTALVTAGLGPWQLPDLSSAPIPLFQAGTTAVPAFAVSNLVTVPALNCMSAASYGAPLAAPGSIVAGFGSGLSQSTVLSTDAVLPSTLSGTTVELIDTTGTQRNAPLFFVSPSQINFAVSSDLAPGPVLVNVVNATGLIASGYLQLAAVAPSLFSANGNGTGVYAGEALFSSGAHSVTMPVANYSPSQNGWTPVPLHLGDGSDLLFLTLYGTGIRGRQNLTDVKASVGGIPVPVIYAGPQGTFTGLDQLNIGPLPLSLAGRGTVDIVVSINGQAIERCASPNSVAGRCSPIATIKYYHRPLLNYLS